MSLPGPVLLLFGPFLLGLLLLLLGRWPRVNTVGGASAALLLAWLVAGIPLGEAGVNASLFAGETWDLLGRSFFLTPGTQLLFALFYMAVGVLCLIAVALPQGSLFAPLSLMSLSPLAAAVMVRPFSFGIIALLVAVAMLAVLVQQQRPGNTLAAVRFLGMMSLAVPLFLVAEWMISNGPIAFSGAIGRLLLVGLLILLAGFPFHIWVAPLLIEASPLVSTLIFSVVQVVLVIFGYQLLAASPVFQQDTPFLAALRLSGGATVIVGGLLAMTAREYGRLLAYLLLIDMGAAILVLAAGDDFNLQTVILLLCLRFASLTLSACGLALLRRQLPAPSKGGDSFTAGVALARRAPGSVALFTYGTVSLIGLPYTLGFSGRWAAIASVAAGSIDLAVILVLATAAGVVGLVRALGPMLVTPEMDELLGGESRWLQSIVGVILLLFLWLALFPQLILAKVQQLVALF